MQLTGNTILITGGTSGIGLAFAEQFLQLKNTVIICGRRKNRLEEIKTRYPAIITRECDITIASERTRLCDWLLGEYPEINVLVNNAGVQLVTDLTLPVDLERVSTEVETNFIAPCTWLPCWPGTSPKSPGRLS